MKKVTWNLKLNKCHLLIYSVTIFICHGYDFLLCYVKEKVSPEKKNDEPDSDSSSLPSLEDDQNSGTENKQDNKKKKTVKKEEGVKDQKVSP